MRVTEKTGGRFINYAGKTEISFHIGWDSNSKVYEFPKVYRDCLGQHKITHIYVTFFRDIDKDVENMVFRYPKGVCFVAEHYNGREVSVIREEY